MKCPTCETTLSIADRAGIEIDYCPSCRGVWLDRGELDKIIERSMATTDTPTPRYDREDRPASRYGQGKDKYEHEKERRHHRKGFLGDLFDF